MSPLVLMLIAIRAAALGIAIAGDLKQAERLYLLADALEAGTLSDEHMSAVAQKLKERSITDEDWDEVEARIAADSARLQDPVPRPE